MEIMTKSSLGNYIIKIAQNSKAETSKKIQLTLQIQCSNSQEKGNHSQLLGPVHQCLDSEKFFLQIGDQEQNLAHSVVFMKSCLGHFNKEHTSSSLKPHGIVQASGVIFSSTVIILDLHHLLFLVAYHFQEL